LEEEQTLEATVERALEEGALEGMAQNEEHQNPLSTDALLKWRSAVLAEGSCIEGENDASSATGKPWSRFRIRLLKKSSRLLKESGDL